MISTLTSPYRAIFMALAGSFAFISAGLPVQAVTPSAFKGATSLTESAHKAQPVANKRRYNRRYDRKYRDRRVVEAPFTRVESGRDVEVDAPFTYVYSGRHGRRIVAPFVDIYIPY